MTAERIKSQAQLLNAPLAQVCSRPVWQPFVNAQVYSFTGGGSSIYCTDMMLLSLKTKLWPWWDTNGSLKDRLLHHSEMEHSPSNNTAIKFHQGSLQADSMSSPVRYKIPPRNHTAPR